MHLDAADHFGKDCQGQYGSLLNSMFFGIDTETMTVYQAMEGQAVGLYDSEECTFWFVTKDEAAQERLEPETWTSRTL